MHTFLAPPVRLDVICLFALPMTLWDGTGEVGGVGEDDVFSHGCLLQAVSYSIRNGRWSWILTLHHILARCFLKGPHYRLWRRALDLIGHGVDAVAVDGYDDKVVLLLCLFWHRQAKHLVYVLPRNGKLDVSRRAHGSYAAVAGVEQLEGELFALGD